MFQDIELSRECLLAFQMHLNAIAATVSASSTSSTNKLLLSSLPHHDSVADTSVSPGEPEMHIQILTTGYWPSAPNTSEVIIPPELSAMMQKFTDFYTVKYQGRRLVWSHSQERCVMTARFPKGKKDLEVSFFQVSIFNHTGGELFLAESMYDMIRHWC